MNLCCYTRTKVKKNRKHESLLLYKDKSKENREDESLLLYKEKSKKTEKMNLCCHTRRKVKKNREDEPLLLKIPCPTKVDETLWQGKHKKPVQMHLEKELPEV